MRCRLGPIISFAHHACERWPGTITRWHSEISNGLLEALHSLVQAAKRPARGYRSTHRYIAMIYLTAGKLPVGLAHAK